MGFGLIDIAESELVNGTTVLQFLGAAAVELADIDFIGQGVVDTLIYEITSIRRIG